MRVLTLTSNLTGEMGLGQALHLQRRTCLAGRGLDCCARVDTSASCGEKYGGDEKEQEEIAYS